MYVVRRRPEPPETAHETGGQPASGLANVGSSPGQKPRDSLWTLAYSTLRDIPVILKGGSETGMFIHAVCHLRFAL